MFDIPLRPPGAVPEREFLARCIHCGQCVEICPHHCIRLARGFGPTRNTPVVRPRRAPCPLCMKCPSACPSGALDPAVTDMRKAGMGRAHILEDRCHNFTDGVMCWTCYDKCPLRGEAVILKNGITPAITKNCVGCGICEYVCPVRAVVTLPPGRPAPDSALPTEPAPQATAPLEPCKGKVS